MKHVNTPQWEFQCAWLRNTMYVLVGSILMYPCLFLFIFLPEPLKTVWAKMVAVVDSYQKY